METQPTARTVTTLRRAVSVSEMAADASIGVEPRFPSTGYGYIQRGASVGTVQGFPLYRVVRFVEKPDLATAEAYVASGDYLWNPGVFVWNNAALLDAFETYHPPAPPKWAKEAPGM